jgi:CheY-like chemotaxis protein
MMQQSGNTSVAVAGASLLLVEDNRAVSDTVRKIVNRFCAHELTAVDGPREALELFASGSHFDLVISDMAMPEMDGRELVSALRVEHPDLPVLFISGEPHEPEEPNPHELFLLKPFSPRALVAAIEQSLGRG